MPANDDDESVHSDDSVFYDEAYPTTQPNFRISKKRKAVTNDIQQMVSTLINDNTSNLTDFAHTHLFDIHTAEE